MSKVMSETRLEFHLLSINGLEIHYSSNLKDDNRDTLMALGLILMPRKLLLQLGLYPAQLQMV